MNKINKAPDLKNLAWECEGAMVSNYVNKTTIKYDKDYKRNIQ